MSTDTQKVDIVFKKLLFASSATDQNRKFFEEPFTNSPLILNDQIIAGTIPSTSPLGAPKTGSAGTSGDLQLFKDVTLTNVPGTENAFQSNDLVDSISFNYDPNGSYLYHVTKNAGGDIAFGEGDWVVDNAAGTLVFYGTLPSGVSSGAPPKISFYKYIGTKGVSGGITGNLLDIQNMTPTDGTFIVGDGTDFVAESGDTARTSLGLGTGDSPSFAALTIDNLSFDGNTVSSTAGALNLTGTTSVAITSGTNEDVTITPTGTGVLNVDNITIADNTIGSSSGAVTIAPVSGEDINLSPSGGGEVLLAGDATSDLGAVTLQQLNSVATELNAFKEPVRAASTGVLAGAVSLDAFTQEGASNGAFPTQDGVTLIAGDRWLYHEEGFPTLLKHNGIWVIDDPGSPTTKWQISRATDCDTSDKILGAVVFVEEGTIYGERGFKCTNNTAITVGVTDIYFRQFTGLGQVTAGDALSSTNDTLDVNVDDTTIEVSSDALRIKTTYTGQASINTVGTITNGTWNGDTIAIANGGTGATTAASARTNLDVVQRPSLSGTDSGIALFDGASGNQIKGAGVTITGANTDQLAGINNITLDGTGLTETIVISETGITSTGSYSVASGSNGDISLTPNGTGNVVIDNVTISDNTVNTSSGSLNLNATDDIVLAPTGGDVTIGASTNLNVGNITIADQTISSSNVNGDINLSPNGTGTVVVSTDLQVDSLNLDGTTVSSSSAITVASGANGDINLSPDGTGSVVVSTDLQVDNLNLNANTLSSTTGDLNVVSATSQDINLTPGTGGVVNVDNITMDANTISTSSGNLTLSSTGGEVLVPAVTTSSNSLAAATVDFVLDQANASSAKLSARLATTTALAANTYSNGTAGVGATITADANGALGNIDGVSPALNDRIIVKNEGTPAKNGIYEVTQLGDGSNPFILTRVTDMDEQGEFTGASAFVKEGTTNGDQGFLCTSDDTVTVGTTAITWVRFTGLGQITAGEGLTSTGDTLDVNVDGTTIEVSADTVQIATTYTGQTSITTLGTVATGTWEATDVGIAHGGTGASTAADARTNLDVVQRPASANDNRIARFDTDASQIQESLVSIDDTGVLSGATQITVDNLSLDGNTVESTSGALNLTGFTTLDLASGTNSNITLTPGGTGQVVIDTLALDGNTITTTSGSGNNLILASDGGEVRAPSTSGGMSGTAIATKDYVDALSNTSDNKGSVRVATTAALPANTFTDNGGVGDTLTATANGILTVDGVNTVLGDRILVKDEATASRNGIYTVTTEGTVGVPYELTRAVDMDSADEFLGSFTFAQEGSVGADQGFICTTNAPITVNTTSITFVRYTGTAGITAGDGLTKNDTTNTLDVNVDGSTIEINADQVAIHSTYAGQTSITTLGTVSTGTWEATDVAIAHGGTGASDAATARTNLDVVQRPTSANDNRIARFDTDQSAIQESLLSIDDSGVLSGATQITVDNLSIDGNTVSSTSGALNLTGTTTVAITSGTDEDITITPTGTGVLNVDNVTIADNTVSTSSGNLFLTSTGGEVRAPAITTSSDPLAIATKDYVDETSNFSSNKTSVRVATTTALAAVTYDNGTLGDGATLTADANGAIGNIDGIAVAVDDRILVKDQASALQNGIYTLTQLGDGSNPFILTRATNQNEQGEFTGSFTFVKEGTVNQDRGYLCTTDDVVTVGTTAINWVEFTGTYGLEAGNVTTINGNAVDVTVDGTTIEVSGSALQIATTYTGQTSITTLGTISTGTWEATDVAIAHGGTGASDAATARTNLDVVQRPATANDNRIARFDTNESAIQESGVTIDDSDVMSGITQLNVDNVRLDGNTVSSTTGDLNLTGTSAVTITSGASQNITLTPGTGAFVVVDNVTIDANTISSSTGALNLTSATNENINLTPAGTGVVAIDNITANGNTITTTSGGLTLSALSGEDVTVSVAGGGEFIVPAINAGSSANTAANKSYVDNVASGLDAKDSARAATTAALPAVTYDNGTSGVGATLTADANGALAAQDGVTLVVSDRLLVKNQASGLQNGIYTVTQVGDGSNPFILTRATDNDESTEIVSAFVFIEEGTANADSGWVCTTDAPVTMGTTAITWTQFSGAGQITAGDGLTKTGNTLDVNVDGTTIEISADTLQIATAYVGQTSITTLGTITTGVWNGTDIAIADGGTGASTAADARTNLDVVQRPVSANDNRIARFDTDASRIQESGITIDDSDVMSGITQLNVDNLRLDGNTLSSTAGAINLSSFTNQNINITPDGTGVVAIDNLSLADNAIQSTSGTLDFTSATTMSLTSGTDSNITITPTGTGIVAIDNLSLADNAIQSTSGTLDFTSATTMSLTSGTDSNISITPTGTGVVLIDNLSLSDNTITTTSGDLTLNATSEVTTKAVTNTSADLAVATVSYAKGFEGFAIVSSAVNYKTVAALPAYTQAGAGAGATLTADANGALSVDGVAVTGGQLVLVDSNGSSADSDNGVYTVTQTGDGSNPFILTRFTGNDSAIEAQPGAYVKVTGGNTASNTEWFITSQVTTVDTDDMIWSQIGSSANLTTIGTPTDGQFGDTSSTAGLSSSDTIADGFDKVDTILGLLAPAGPNNLSTFTSLTLDDATYSAIKADTTDTVVTNVQNNASNQPSISNIGSSASPAGFGDASTGTLTASIDSTGGGATAQGAIALTTGDDTGSNGALVIVSDDDHYLGTQGKAGFVNSLIANINSNGNITFTPSNANQYSMQLQHSTTGNTNIVTFYQDDAHSLGTASISASPTLSSPASTDQVSGVTVLGPSSTIDVGYTINNCIGEFHNATWVGQASATEVTTDNFLPTGQSGPVASLAASRTLSIVSGVFNSGLVVDVVCRKSDGTTSATVQTTTSNVYVDSASLASTGANGDFINEGTTGDIQRRKSQVGQYPTYSDTAYDKTANIETDVGSNEELQLIGGEYQYPPTINYTSYIPAGPDYSTITAGTYNNTRWATFRFSGSRAVTNASYIEFDISGQSGSWGTSAIISGISLYVKIDNGSSNTNWISANDAYDGVSTPSANGDAALDISSSTQTRRRVTFGPTVRSGNVVVRIGLPQGSTLKFTGISAVNF